MEENIWFTSKDLMERWKMNAPTLAQYILNKSLSAHPTIADKGPEDLRGRVMGPNGLTWSNQYKLSNLGNIIRFIDEFIFLRKDVLEFEAQHGLSNKSPSPISKDGTLKDYEQFVRSLRVSYENDEQIRIQGLGKPSQPYTYASLGFKKSGKIWKTFLQILQDQEHSYNVGPAHKVSAGIKQRIKYYDQNLGSLRTLNAKWIDFIHSKFGLQAPKGFKVFEKRKDERPGTYGFKFQIMNGSDEKKGGKYDQHSKEELLSVIKDLQTKKGFLNGSERDNATDALMEVRKRKLMSDKQIEAIVREISESYKNKEKIEYDCHENEEHDD